MADGIDGRGVDGRGVELAEGFAGDVGANADLDLLRFEGTDLTGLHAENAAVLECVFDAVDLSDGGWAGSRWSGSTLTSTRAIGLDLSRTTWNEVTVIDPRWGAVQAHGCSWRQVTVTGGKIDFANLRGSDLREVRFVDVMLIGLEFAEARLTDVSFEGCTLRDPDFGRARLTRVDLSTADLERPLGVTSLAGASISRVQLLDLADAFAEQLGVRVVDPGEQRRPGA